MIEFLLSFVFLLLIVSAMAVGVMRGRAPITGSCGGLNNLGVGGACEICGGDPMKCESAGAGERDTARRSGPDAFYDAAAGSDQSSRRDS